MQKNKKERKAYDEQVWLEEKLHDLLVVYI
jgi:hypothetical protein